MANSFSSAVFTAFFSKVTILVLSTAFTPLLVRLLGPTRYGHYAIVLSVFAIVAIFMMAGTTEAVRKYVSERQDRDWQAAVVSYIFRPAIGIGLLGALGFFLAAWSGLAARVFGAPFTSLFYLLGLYAIGRQLRVHILFTLMGLHLESVSEPLKVVQKVLFVVLALVLVYVGFGVEGVLIADVVTSAFTIVVGSAFLVRELPRRSLVRAPDVSLPKEQIRTYSFNTVWFYLFLMSLYHVDVLILQHWTTDRTVGFYKGALVIAEVLWVAPLAIQLVLLQRVSQLWETGDLETIDRRASLVTHHVFLLTALLAIGVAVLAFDLVPLYLGESFAPAAIPLLVLLPGVLGFAIARPTIAINQARRSLRPLLLATGASSAINLVLNVALIPQYGMVGAAVATSVGYGSLVVFQSVVARNLGYRPLAGVRWRSTILTVAATLLVIVPLTVVLTSSLVALVVVPPVGAIVYVSAAFVTGAVTADEVERVVDAVGLLPERLERQLLVAVRRLARVQN
ncbi:polysaccharide biosynthesis C-terminal domain-containing protein [Natronobeatus ordinarius]|uniref:oligosaccharide flippase family protein n=1 Tax=Natronobeatus ordinarius TaxID=2963433 RepID=UPI0020CCC9BA|nr:polysaccharide biosynthesis C-terminal domain-containing protein [Natronobeatus ordinarius]